VTDPTALASGAMQWTISLPARDSADVWIAMPAERADTSMLSASAAAAAIDAARHIWDRELGSLEIDLSGSGAALARTLRTSLANVMINSRGSALQPGTRSYRRSWIRDGALTSAALLRLGHAADVRAFLDWYAPFLFADGKAPCCVDTRGADPVAENDSDGEFLFLAAEYWRFTHDTQTVVRHWAALARTAAHLDSLRQTRRTSLYQSPESLLVFGLLPPSISHEGYSAKPAYSYWDDWWGVRGMGDAAMLAGVAGDTARARRFNRSAKEFRADVVASVARAMRVHRMPVMPGAADLGDFDPTSSTIALEPAQALDDLPRATVSATFDSAWANFRHRRAADNWEVYTPYEWRQVGSFIRLGQPERAHALAEWFMATRRPAEWNEWSEAIWRNARAPTFIGDMPHGWVASDFIRATLDMIAYERESDSTLVVGAGIPLEWARSSTGVTARGIRTWWGTLALTMHMTGNVVRMTIDGVQPPGGIVVRAPFGQSARSARVNGKPTTLNAGHEVIVRAPAVVEFEY
jgi:Glucoamylase and related glycosyl hydrolases